MTLAAVLAALDTIATLEAKIRAAYPELDRRARISSRADGYPSRASGAQPGTVTHTDRPDDEGTAISYTDSVGDAVLTLHRPDPVDRRRRTIERIVTRAARDLEGAVAQLTEPTEVAGNEPWCANCARVKHTDGTPHLEPVYSKAKAKTDVGGRLTEPQYLCRFDYDYVLGEGKLAPLDFTRERLAKGRAPRKIA